MNNDGLVPTPKTEYDSLDNVFDEYTHTMAGARRTSVLHPRGSQLQFLHSTPWNAPGSGVPELSVRQVFTHAIAATHHIPACTANTEPWIVHSTVGKVLATRP